MKRGLYFASGLLVGMALFGGGTAYAAGLMAEPSSQTFYLDGKQIYLQAYAIGGNNYVKLRDIGQAVDFGVTYDGSTNSVHIDPNSHYEQEVNQSAQTTFSPAAPTEESIKTAIWTLRDTYPTGTYYGAFYRSYSNGPYGAAPTHCAGWATLCSDAALGDLQWRRINSPSWEDIRPGDLIEYDNATGGHVVVVLEKTDEYVKVTESGTNNKARWGGEVT